MADLVFDLGAEAPEDRELDASLLAAQVALRLRQAADRPHDVSRELPVVELLWAHVEAGELVVALEVRLDIGDPAESLVVDPESPSAHESEAEVAHGVVEVRELPVEDADEAVLVDDDVADAVVAVVDDLLPGSGRVLLKPPQAELDRGMGLADLVQLFHHPFQPRLGEKREALARDGVDLRELLGQLQGQTGRHVHANDPAADRLALEALHDERFAPVELVDVDDRSRHLDSRLERDR